METMEVFITDYDTPDNPAWPEYSPSARALASTFPHRDVIGGLKTWLV